MWSDDSDFESPAIKLRRKVDKILLNITNFPIPKSPSTADVKSDSVMNDENVCRRESGCSSEVRGPLWGCFRVAQKIN